MCITSPAYAESPELLQDGTSGSCTWKYERIDGDTVLTIAPASGDKGTLGPFSWADSQYKESATRIVVKAKVHAGSSTDSMFEDFERAKSIDLSGLDITGVTSMKAMFSECEALTSLDVSQWNMSKVLDMRWMFSGCRALTSLDLGTWCISDKTQMKGMFTGTLSLRKIRLGGSFCISRDAKFEDAGLRVGTKWMQVNLGKGGTLENPKGKVFGSSSELIAFHCDRAKRETDTEEYLRVAFDPSAVSFNTGTSDAASEKTLQAYSIGAAKTPTDNAHERPGFRFAGWNVSDTNPCTDEQSTANSCFGKAVSSVYASQRALQLDAQWKVHIVYEVKEGTKATPSRALEELGSRGDPLGTEVVVEGGIPQGKEIVWTVKTGGNDNASHWSYKGAVLGKVEVKGAALKDGELVPTIFVAELADKASTI